MIYLVSIITANLTTALFGPDVAVINAFLFIGLDLTARDRLHELWHKQGLVWKMGLLIVAGSAISYLLNTNAGPIALASLVAFTLAAVADTIVYSLLHRVKWLWRSNGSNLVSAGVDSLVFPTIAFGSLLPLIVLGQFVAKVSGGLLWSLILNYRKAQAQNANKL